MSELILVIDDDPIVRDVLKRVLESESYRVAFAINGREGVERFRELAPALVITDIIMPEKEGLETIVEIRKLDAKAKIIAVSGGGRIGNADLLKMAGQFGASEILSKPFEPDDLLDKVKKHLPAAA